MSDLTIFNNKNIAIPAYTTNPNSEIDVGSGVYSGIQHIKLHGQSFVVSDGGEKSIIGDHVTGSIIGSNEALSKKCYLKPFDGVGGKAPDCASCDGIKPDSGIENPFALKCKDCEYDAWGSEVNSAGVGVKKCKDYRRMAFCVKHNEVYKIYRFDIPGGSLTALQKYGEKAKKAGVPLEAAFTTISFDAVKTNKLKFEALQCMTLAQHEVYKKLMDDPRVTEILTQKTSSNNSDDVEDTPAPETKPEVTATPDSNAVVTPAEPIPNIESAQNIEAELDAFTKAIE